MDRSEPVLFPEWLRAGNRGSTGSANPNQSAKPSSQSGEHDIETPSRNRPLLGTGDRGAPRLLGFSNSGSSSIRGTSSGNGFLSRDKESSASSHPYSSFGRKSRDRGREKDRDLRVKDRPLAVNGFHDRPDSFKPASKDKVRRSQSMGSGRQTDYWPRGQGKDSQNGVLSRGSMASGNSKSFDGKSDKDFPSLRAEERQPIPDRVSSPGLSPSVQSLPIGSSAVIGGDGWTSALVKLPAIVVGNGPVVSSALQSPSTPTSLNMAETLAQAPSIRTPPQMCIDTPRIDELTLKQCKQLIPVTSSGSKTSVINSCDKLKSKGARGDVSCPTKIGQHSSNLVNHGQRSLRSDIPKTQSGNYQVLKRERNGVFPTTNDAGRVVDPFSTVSSASVPHTKSPLSPNLGEKRRVQNRNRNQFFDSLRNKASTNHQPAPSSSSELGKQLTVYQENDGSDACEKPERFLSGNEEDVLCLDPDEEEAAFLRLLGWEENGGDGALTNEEIDAFFKEHGELRPASKLATIDDR